MTADTEAVPADAIDASFVPRRRTSVVSLEVEGDVVLLDVGTGHVHHLDPVGGIVWECFDGSGTIAEIVTDLSAEFGADSATIADDVVDVARNLGSSGLLEGVAPAPDPLALGVFGHGPDLCDDHDHDWDPDEPTLSSHRFVPARSHTAPQTRAEAGEPRFLVEPPSS